MKSVQLKEIITQIRGVSYSKGDAVSNEIRGYIPLIRANNILDGILTKDDLLYVPASIVKEKQLIKTGDIVIAASSGSINIVGKAAYSPDNLNSTFGAFCKLIRPNTKHVLPGYLNFYFQSNAYRKKISSLAQGANINNLKNEHIDELEILLPPLPEQKRIAEILDKANALRQKNKQLLVAYDELLQATFLDMFGDPITNPMGWKKEELSEVIKIKHGYAFKSKYFANEGDFILLTPGNFNEQGGFREQKKQKYYIGDFPQDYILKTQDLLLAMTEQAVGLLGSALFVPSVGVYLHNQRLGLVKYLIEINPTFLYFIFNHPSTREQIQKGATGTKVRHTSPRRIVQIKTLLPPISLQNQFAQIVENIEAQKALVKQSLQESEDLFNGLVQKAFGGEL